MKYGWRERISGAVILIALAVIFVPLLFSEPAPRSERPQPVLTIQQPIEVPRQEVPEPRPPASLAEFGEPVAAPGEEELLLEESPVEEVTVEEVAEVAEQAAEQPPRAEAPAEPSPSPAPAPASEPAVDPIAELARAADQRLAESASRSQPAPAASGGEWAVQVGSFGEPANAERLLQQLREQGFPAYSQPRDNNLTTVYAGPYGSSEAGERAMNELKSRANLQGLLVRARN